MKYIQTIDEQIVYQRLKSSNEINISLELLLKLYRMIDNIGFDTDYIKILTILFYCTSSSSTYARNIINKFNSRT